MGIWDKAVKYVESELDSRINNFDTPIMSEPLNKALKEDGYGRKGLIFDPFQDQGYSGGLFRPKGAGSGFLSNFILKLVSRRDPIVSTILHLRSNQTGTFCRRQSNRFDTGFKIECRDSSDIDEDEIKEIESFVLNCGETENRSKEDILTFPEWGYMITHDMLTYGHCAIEMVKNRGGNLFAFLPLPAETIYYTNKNLVNKEQIGTMIDTYRDAYQSIHGKTERLDNDEYLNEQYEYLQVINGKVVEGFMQDEMILGKIYELSEIDLNGYAIGPLERAMMMITAHLQIENHQKMFFTHGVASRGLLVIQGDVSPNQLRTLQAQWTNQVTGSQSAWRTPILAGIKGVQWEPLTIANRDMEYAAYQDHVIRTMHACFAIDAEETGFGYLSKGVQQRAASEKNNEWKVTASRDKGLRPLLARIEALLNDKILPAWNPKYADKYKFCFVGLDAENREEEIQRLQAEVQLHTKLDEAREQAELQPMDIGGGLILNPLLISTLQSNIFKGVFMEKFLGVEGASERPDLQYIPDPMWFQWQQFQMEMMQQQAMAEAGVSPGGPEGGGNGNSNSSGGGGSSSKPSGNGSNSDADKKAKEKAEAEKQAQIEAQQQALAEAQLSAIDKFIVSNPALFKSMQEHLKKSEFNNDHVNKVRKDLTKDFEKASEKLMRDIFSSVKEDLDDRRVEKSEYKDKLPGGSADKKKPSDFNSEQLKIGAQHEMEHTKDKSLAQEIAMDHLIEDPDYYKKMKKEDFVSEDSVGDFLTDKDGQEVSPKKKKKRVKTKDTKKD